MLEGSGVGCRNRKGASLADVVAEGEKDNGLRRMGTDMGKPWLGLAMLRFDDRG